MNTDTQHLVYHRSRVSELEHELALARAGESYWRAKYIAIANPKRTLAEMWRSGQLERENALYWFERAARSPMDDCDE